MTWFIQVLIQMGDAYGLTVSTEMARMAQKDGAGADCSAVRHERLTSDSLFFYHYAIMAFLIVGSLLSCWENRGYSLKSGWRLPRLQVKHYIKEFYDYSHPLFVYVLVGLIVPYSTAWRCRFSAAV